MLVYTNKSLIVKIGNNRNRFNVPKMNKIWNSVTNRNNIDVVLSKSQ